MSHASSKSKVDSPLRGSSSKKRASVATNHNFQNYRDLTPVRRRTTDFDGEAENYRGSYPDLRSNDLATQCNKKVIQSCFELNTPKLRLRGTSCEKRRRVASDDCLLTGDDELGTGIIVAVRVRPFTERECAEDVKCVVTMEENVTTLRADDRPAGEVYHFKFDHCFWSFNRNPQLSATGSLSVYDLNGLSQCDHADQMTVYQTIGRPLLDNVFKGYNACLFAYGQTGSGKSYSMMGNADDPGVIPRFCRDMFTRIENSDPSMQLNAEMSFFEIYNEKIHDLLAPSGQPSTAPASTPGGSAGSNNKINKKPVLKVREHPKLGPFVEGLSCYVVRSYDDVNYWLSVGNKHRVTAATSMNDSSSRSHSVFTMVLSQTQLSEVRADNEEMEEAGWSHSVTSKINLVDLAGSERQSLAKTVGDRLREGSMINKSLMTLGKVIVCLAENSAGGSRRQKVYVPYRESALTWLLKESLGGNSKTAMLTTISPSRVHVEETLSALRYASQARRIVNIARINEDPNARIIRELRAEIEKLRRRMDGGNPGRSLDAAAEAAGAAGGRSPSAADEIARLKQQLLQKELEMKELASTWEDRLAKTELRRFEERELSEKSKLIVGDQISCEEPNITNLNEDPQLSEVLLYVLCEGQTVVGRSYESNSEADNVITLFDSELVTDKHCLFDRKGSSVSLMSINNSRTYVNGELIGSSPVVLQHGDCINFGGEHFFRFSNPLQIKTGSKVTTKDFRDAMEEFMLGNNKRLEAELSALRTQHEADLQQATTSKIVEQEGVINQLKIGEMESKSKLKEYEDKVQDLEQELKENQKRENVAKNYKFEMGKHIEKLEMERERLQAEVLSSQRLQDILNKKTTQFDNISHERKNLKAVIELTKKLHKESLSDSRQLKELQKTPILFTCGPRAKSDRIINSSSTLSLQLLDANLLSDLLHKDLKFSKKRIIKAESTPGLSYYNNILNSHGSVEDKNSFCVEVQRELDGTSYTWTREKFASNLNTLYNLYKGEISDDRAEELMFDQM